MSEVLISEVTLRGHARDLEARLYAPAHAVARELVVYLHEGGFTCGGLDAAHATVHSAASTLARRVLALAYSLAPAEPFPAALEDTLCAIDWAARDGDAVIVAGTEAGGNLAAAAALAARDRALPPLLAQMLITPMLDPALSSSSMRGTALADRRSTRCWFACYRSYLPSVSDRLHPYAAPATATRLAGLAPAFVVTADDDPLRGEAEQYATRLEQAGVISQLLRAPALAQLGNPADAPWIWQAFDAFLARCAASPAHLRRKQASEP